MVGFVGLVDQDQDQLAPIPFCSSCFMARVLLRFFVDNMRVLPPRELRAEGQNKML